MAELTAQSLDADARNAIKDAQAVIRKARKPQKDAQRKKARDERRARVKAIGKPAKGQRQPRVQEPLYLAWIRRQPCLHCQKTPCDAAHIRFVPQGSGWAFSGMGAKPDDWRTVPMCRTAHTMQHSINECKFWENVLNLNPVETVARLRAEYLGQLETAR